MFWPNSRQPCRSAQPARSSPCSCWTGRRWNWSIQRSWRRRIPAENQYGKTHWPTLRIAVAHNLANGLASRPSWGAMYGPHAVSEQTLAEELMDRLPQGAVVVGDRNFGVFSIAYAATEKGLGILLRLTE